MILQELGVMSLWHFGHFFHSKVGSTLELELLWIQAENSWYPLQMSKIHTFQSCVPFRPSGSECSYSKDGFSVEFYSKFLVQRQKHNFKILSFEFYYCDYTICTVMAISAQCFQILQKKCPFEQMFWGTTCSSAACSRWLGTEEWS